MKICIAQTSPVKGDIVSNIKIHRKLIDLAIGNAAEVIIFPELSLTGYEPTLALSLAIDPLDNRLNEFQDVSDQKRIAIGVGVPTRNENGICISMIIFQPDQNRSVYSKKYLHPDEEDYFVHGHNFPVVKVKNSKLALAICYEISVTQHTEEAFAKGAEIYIASVVKFVHGLNGSSKRLSDIARKYSCMVLMANSIGQADGHVSAGQSAVWNAQGEIIAHLDHQHEGIIVVDTVSQAVIHNTI